MCWQAVTSECETNNFDLQPTFSECLEYIEGDPYEDSRQSKKQKVPFPPTPSPTTSLSRDVSDIVDMW